MSHLLPLKSAFEASVQRLDRADGKFSDLPMTVQILLLVYSAQGVIDNGGFQYFFEMDWPGHPEYLAFSDAYRAIGANDAATCIDKAVSFFDFENPERFENQRILFMNTLPEGHQFFKLSDYVSGDNSVWAALFQNS
ncbi:MAG: DUF4375 domain-containing protein [Holophaga sp.]|nr:DUF4375 domain-containing protein [Holophaga sp.]